MHGGLQARKREGRMQGLPEAVTLASWRDNVLSPESGQELRVFVGRGGGVSVTHGDEVMAGGLLCLFLR